MKRDSFITAVCCIIIAVIMWLAIMAESASADDGKESGWNECGSHEVQDIMWEYLMGRFDNNPIAAAAIMGNAGVESNFCPWRYTGCNTVEDGYQQSKDYVDECDEEHFVYYWFCYPQGFGLFQFATNYHMQNLWNRAQESGVPVYDVKLQCEYMLDNLQDKRPEVYEYFFDCEDLIDATEVFRAFGEGSTFSERSVNHRTSRALEVYERYTGEEYTGKIYFPTWNGGSLHCLKK